MNALDALRRMVASYPGGRAALAIRLGKTDEVLRKELSGVQTHKMGLADAEEIAAMCHEVGSPDQHALATVFSLRSGSLLELPVVEMGLGGKCLATSTASAVHECADVLLAVTRAKSDGHISDNDKRAVRKEIGETVAALQAALQALDHEHAADNQGRAQA